MVQFIAKRKPRQKSVFNVYCDVCEADLGPVTSNLKATQKLLAHKRNRHYGLNI